jgi:CysZ protein
VKNAILSFQPAFSLIYKNKINFLLALIPVIIGITLYYFAGTNIYTFAMAKGDAFIKEYVGDGTYANISYYIVATVLTVVLFFLVNWTFVLVVSIIASPFNDILSERIEKIYNGEPMTEIGASISSRFGKILGILFNEVKKISFILSLTVLSLILSIFPVLAPLVIVISIFLLCMEFVDYSWSRHSLTFGQCVKDLWKHKLGYLIGGALFFGIVSIPLINLFVPSLATSFFTVFWVKNHANSNTNT